jgi:adenylate kinase
MRIMIAGLPGSGKTTQAQKLSDDLKIPFVSMGAILRDIAKESSELGLLVKKAIGLGELVDDQTTAQILQKELQKEIYQAGYIIDGYPRDIDQLDFFDPNYDFVFYLKISPEEGRRRLMSRHRSDDLPEVIDQRFVIQQQKLEPLLEEFKRIYKFIELNGEEAISQIHQQIIDYLKKENI